MLKDLRVLNFKQNKISLDMLPFSWRTNLPKLETLILSQNFIGPQLTEVDFDFKQTQMSIDLSNNNITSIILDSFREQACFNIEFGVRKGTIIGYLFSSRLGVESVLRCPKILTIVTVSRTFW